MIEQLLNGRTGPRVKGPQLAELTQEEITAHIALLARGRELSDRARMLEIDSQQLTVDNDRRWMELKKKYAIEAEGITYEDGKLFQLVDKEEVAEPETVPA